MMMSQLNSCPEWGARTTMLMWVGRVNVRGTTVVIVERQIGAVQRVHSSILCCKILQGIIIFVAKISKLLVDRGGAGETKGPRRLERTELKGLETIK